MPIKYANVVVFFGGDSLTRLESMLRYYNTILSRNDWQSFLFILATPNGQSVHMLSSDIPGYIRARCCDGCGNPQTLIYQNTAQTIHGMYHSGMLNLHLICDDFASAIFPAQAPAVLTQIIRDVTHISLMPYYYLILHARDSEKTSRQRQLLQRLHDDEQANIYQYPYLLSVEQDDNSLANPESLWRALMCEILVISFARRTHQHGTLSSLGYTSLNANEKELINLRRQHLLNHMQSLCSSPYTENAAWQELLNTKQSMPDRQNTIDITSQVHHWLQERIRQDMTSPSSYQIDNFRALTCALSRKEPIDLLSNAKRFFEMNLRYKNTAQDTRPEYVSAKRYGADLLSRLSTGLNLCNFPVSVIHLILQSLQSLRAYQPQAFVPDYPQENFLQKSIAQQHRKYMLQCCNIAETAARNQIIESLIPVYAKAYSEMFAYLIKLLDNTAKIHAAISNLMISSDAFVSLQAKYPQYNQDIINTLNKQTQPLFNAVRLYHPATAEPIVQQIKDALEKADIHMHSRMSPGFRTTFISAIMHEFPTTNAMDNFLGNYLINKRRMFCNILEPVNTAEVRHFADEQLDTTNWVMAHRNNTFSVKNDNVERLDYFTLNQNLSDFLSEGNRQNPDNEYFWQVNPNEDGIDLPSAPIVESPAPTLPIAQQVQQSKAVQVPAEKPVEACLSLLEDLGRTLLTWEWDPAVPFYEVRINNKPHPIHQGKYSANHGMVVDGLLHPGKNTIILSILNGAKICEQDLCGPQTQVDYKKTSNALYTAYVPEAIGSLLIRETFHLRDEHGNERDTYFYYPLDAYEPAHGKDIVCYEGLRFSGNWELISDPQDPFCRYAPRYNPNLSSI